RITTTNPSRHGARVEAKTRNLFDSPPTPAKVAIAIAQLSTPSNAMPVSYRNSVAIPVMAPAANMRLAVTRVRNTETIRAEPIKFSSDTGAIARPENSFSTPKIHKKLTADAPAATRVLQ